MFDPVLLRTFLAVEQTGGFTAAARHLGLRQSTVSGHIARLERAAGRALLSRDTHTVELTADGTAMVGFARSILDAHDRAAGTSRDRHSPDGCGSGPRRTWSRRDCRRSCGTSGAPIRWWTCSSRWG